MHCTTGEWRKNYFMALRLESPLAMLKIKYIDVNQVILHIKGEFKAVSEEIQYFEEVAKIFVQMNSMLKVKK